MENNCSRCSYLNNLDAGWERAFKNHPRTEFILAMNKGVSGLNILHSQLKWKLYEVEASDSGIFSGNPDFKEGYLEALMDIYVDTYNLAFLEAEREREGV
jgi:hypothetical protein